jgi:hypothetical protein
VVNRSLRAIVVVQGNREIVDVLHADWLIA